MPSSTPESSNAQPRAGESYRALRRLAIEWWQLRGQILRSWVATALAVGAALALPWPLKLLIDDVLAPSSAQAADWAEQLSARLGMSLGHTELVLLLAAAMGLAAWLAAVASAREKLTNAAIREAFGVRLRDVLLAHVLRLGPRALGAERRGELVLRLVDDVARVNRLFNKTLPQLLRHTAMTLGLLVVLAAIDWRMASIAAGLTLLLGGLARAHARDMQHAAFAKRHREGSVAGLAQELVAAVEHVQMHSAEERVRERFRTTNERSFAAGIAETATTVNLERRMQVLGGAAVALLAAAGALLVQRGVLSVGTLTVCITYMTQLLKPVEKLNELTSDVMQGTARATRLLQLLESTAGVPDTGTEVPRRDALLSVTLEQVSFGYAESSAAAEREVLDGASAQFRSGEIVALIGANGSGKSTLVRLLLRIVDPVSGRLLLNGRPYSEYRIDALRRCFAVSTQQHRSFQGTVRELLQGIEPTAADEAMWRALGEVQLDGYVRALPAGLDTRLAEDATNLSGGQRARLALAAALLADRPILILDEPFANIDDVSRRIVLASLSANRDRRLCIAITHEHSLLAIADRVVRIDDGALTTLEDATADPAPPREVRHVAS